VKSSRSFNWTVCAAALATYALQSPIAMAQPVAPTPPEPLSWNGDPAAPDFSGVWVRADDQGKAVSASPEGWRPWPPQLKGPFAATWKTRVADAAAGKRADDPIVGCLPPGMPRFITGDKSPLLIIQNRGRVTEYRDGEGPRRIWLDGRSFPAQGDVEVFPKGTSIGRYDGQDMVIDTIGVRDQPIDSTGVPHSDQLKITERYHRSDAKTLKVQVTLNDPAAYGRPMTTTVIYTLLNDPQWEPHEVICKPKTDFHGEHFVH